jgi:hypothetical protein
MELLEPRFLMSGSLLGSVVAANLADGGQSGQEAQVVVQLPTTNGPTEAAGSLGRSHRIWDGCDQYYPVMIEGVCGGPDIAAGSSGGVLIKADCVIAEVYPMIMFQKRIRISLFLSETGNLDQTAVPIGGVDTIAWAGEWGATVVANYRVPASLAGGQYYLIAKNLDAPNDPSLLAVSDPITVLPGPDSRSSDGGANPGPWRGHHHGDGGWGDAGALVAEGGIGVAGPASPADNATAALQLAPVISSIQQQPLTASPTNQIVADSSNSGTDSQGDGTPAPSTPISSDASADSDPLQLGGTLRVRM